MRKSVKKSRHTWENARHNAHSIREKDVTRHVMRHAANTSRENWVFIPLGRRMDAEIDEGEDPKRPPL